MPSMSNKSKYTKYVLGCMVALGFVTIACLLCMPTNLIKKRQLADELAQDRFMAEHTTIAVVPVIYKVPIVQKRKRPMPTGTDISAGVKLQSQSVANNTSNLVFTIAPGTAEYTQLAAWAAYRVANPSVPAPLFLMGSNETTGYLYQNNLSNITLQINGGTAFAANGGAGDGVYIYPPGTYNAGNAYGAIAGFNVAPVMGGFDFPNADFAILDGTHSVILTIPQAAGSCYAGNSVSLIILPDSQVTGVSASALWTNIGLATSPAPYVQITPSAGANGTISPNTVQYIPQTTTATFTATPASGYSVVGWYVNGSSKAAQLGGTSFTTPAVYVPMTVNVTFAMTVATPTVSPAAGTFTTLPSVTLACVTTGSVIKFTTDNSTPSATNGTVYTSPIPLTLSTTIKAYATTAGYIDSGVVSATYMAQLPAPTFSPAAGSYSTQQNVVISEAWIGAAGTIRYTIDSTTPTETHGLIYTPGTPIVVAANTTIQAIAYSATCADSTVASAAYVVTLPTCATPVATPGAGSYTSNQSVVLSCATPNAVIYYTTNNTTPSPTNGTVFTTPITISSTTTLQAVAVLSGYSNSTVLTAVYTVTIPTQCAAPILTPGAGNYTTPPTVTITCATPSSVIKYSLDGSLPSETTGLTYTAPFVVSGGVIQVNAMAYASGLSDSIPVSATYGTPLTLAPVILTPMPFNLASSYNSVGLNVPESNLASGSQWGAIYTLDNSTPSTTNGTKIAQVYGESLYVNVMASQTLQAVVYNFNSQSIDSAITHLCAQPQCNVMPGSYATTPTLTLSCDTPGVSIVFTLDGTTPSATNGTPYTAPFTLPSSCTLQAIAYLSGYTTSAISSGQYVIQQTTVATPVITIQGNPTMVSTNQFADNAESFVITCATPGAHIIFTIDNTTPAAPDETGGSHGNAYTGQFTVNPSTSPYIIIQAIAYVTGLGDSIIASYSFAFALPQIVFTPNAGSPNSFTYQISGASAQIGLQCPSVTGASIYYYYDGTLSPATTSNPQLYAGNMTINSTCAIVAFARLAGYLDGALTFCIYELQTVDTHQCAPPAIVSSPTWLPGYYVTASSITWTITDTTPSAAMIYTLDGTTPTPSLGGATQNGTVYTAPIVLTNDGLTHLLLVVAYLSGYENSVMASSEVRFSASGTPPTPPPTPTPSTYGTLLSSCRSDDNTIHVASYNGSAIKYCNGPANGLLSADITVVTDSTVTGLSIQALNSNQLVIIYANSASAKQMKYSSNRGINWY